ncbi:MAG: hypothetical protein U0R64_00215 [Candidatus Nanopelagicales bacterium]
MSVLLGVSAAVLVVVGLVALAGFVISRTVVRGNAAKAAVALGPAAPGDLDESAALLAPRRAFGMLRLSGDAVRFADADGVITTIPRVGLTAMVSADEGLRRPCLVVAHQDEAWSFAVADPEDWVRRLGA